MKFQTKYVRIFPQMLENNNFNQKNRNFGIRRPLKFKASYCLEKNSLRGGDNLLQ